MAYYKVRIEVWCGWNPAESDLEEIAESMSVGEAICTRREVVKVELRSKELVCGIASALQRHLSQEQVLIG
jgi:hypothetical protein